jgi:hypothetical protein
MTNKAASTAKPPRLVSVAKYNSKGNWSDFEQGMVMFKKEHQLRQHYHGEWMARYLESFDTLLGDSFTWDQLQKFLLGDDSIRMVISKKGLDDIKKGTIKICDDTMVGNGRHRLSRNYKKTNNRVKSSKKRSHTTKSRRTRRHRK